MKNKLLKYGILTFLWFAYTLPALAGPGGGDEDGEGEADPEVPIDNWMLLLILAGIAVGVYFIMRSRRKAVA